VAAANVQVSRNSGKAGTAVTASGNGFFAGEEVKISYATGLSAPNPTKVVICTATVAADTSYTCNGHIPSGTTAGVKGAHKITAKGVTSGLKATTTFTRTKT